MIIAAVNWAAVEAIATAVGAVVTAGAFVVTYLLLRLEARARHDQEAALAQDRLDRERAQARRVSSWVDGPFGSDGQGRVRVKLHVRNLSDEPIVAVLVVALYDPEVIGGGEAAAAERTVAAWEIVPPGETLSRSEIVAGLETGMGGVDAPPARVEFVDANGLKWTRWPDGTLERLVENSAKS